MFCILFQYAMVLGKFMANQPNEKLRVWTSLEQHAIETSILVDRSVQREHWKPLDDLDAVRISTQYRLH